MQTRSIDATNRLKARSHHESFVERCRKLAPVRMAVVHPCDRLALESAIASAHAGLIVPVLVGNQDKIRAVASSESLDIDGARRRIDERESPLRRVSTRDNARGLRPSYG
jgi:hypothetical protein